uniref:Zinc finger protein 704-like n=1 Tax=Gouania willdenowi TaxID=441366 RepID=A0A8C5G3Q7_GOUWI
MPQDMLPKARLGKRSPLGALLSFSCPAPGTHLDAHEAGITMETAPGHQTTKFKGHPAMKVYFEGGAAGESSGVDRLDSSQKEASFLPVSSVSPPCSRSVSSSINVPSSQRSRTDVDMDELMAAMVLSTLSCSGHSSAHQEAAAPPMDTGSSEHSDDGSCGYWSIGHPHSSPGSFSPKADSDSDQVTPPDEGLVMELNEVLFDEPAPRRRRNSVKASYRCLWPSCAKELTTMVGIKRHIRTTHLCRGGEHERCSPSEEDFYYTEVNQWEQALTQHGRSPSPLSPPSPPPPSPSPPTLSRSAPSISSLWQVQSEHSYQAPPPSNDATALTTPASCWTPPPTACQPQSVAVRVRSVSVGEHWLQHQGSLCRKIRSEAKKCRKVYGIEHREQWCTACRWKKACQRFLD